MSTPFDPGLQPERTALAWRRTCLAVLAGSLVAARILPELFGAWSALLGIAGAVAAATLLAAVHRRYRSHHRRLHAHGDRVALADGRLIAALAILAASAGAVSVIAVALVAARP
ncbi:DUF202 domain-containing protein [Leifsonia virtsii]|uniref:DUF202 domain-containing protein n=1 Tax=Leifsonia virtsii TaxID=3035915 RepID=A0ABT8J318_9MICO|nr:DUF202 domain-containing protein [Leifsonia virtsii]MDN4599484.1 DUF202 domain-containing protein [Leifsonia virtsii]